MRIPAIAFLAVAVACGGSQAIRTPGGEAQAPAEAWPEARFVAATACSDLGPAAARKAAADEVARRVNTRMEAELASILQASAGPDGAGRWAGIVERLRESAPFPDVDLVRSDPGDVFEKGGRACAVAHLSRAEALDRLSARWRESEAWLRAAADRADRAFMAEDRRCEGTFMAGECDAFAPAWKEARNALAELLRTHRDRRALGGPRTDELGPVEEIRDRLATNAGRLRGLAVFAISVEADTADHRTAVGEAVAATFQGLGVRARIVDGEACAADATHQARARADLACESTPVGPSCLVTVAIEGGRCHKAGAPLQVKYHPSESSLHRRDRDAAIAAAFRAIATDPGFGAAVREALGRVLPL